MYKLLPSAVLLSACSFTAIQIDVTAGKTGCSPDAITISEERNNFASITWRADCDGRVYRCSGVSAGKSVEYNCTEAHGATMMTTAQIPPATSAPQQPSAAPAPAPAAAPAQAVEPPAPGDCTQPQADTAYCRSRCDTAGEVAACHRTAVALESAQDRARALEYYRKACTAGHQNDCRRVKMLSNH